MPIISCEENGKPGYKYDESGKCYTYSKDDENSRKEAKKKAILQGVAIEGGSPHLEKADGTQVIDHSKEFVKEENFGDLEMATYAYNIAFRDGDIRHNCKASGLLVESLVMTKEKQKAMGIPDGKVPTGVWLGFYFPEDKDWNTIKSMKKPMFSLYGSAVKEYVEEV